MARKPATAKQTGPDRLLAFMKERHKIYLLRAEGKPPPWTEDPVLAQYKFTNVYRELDRVTLWVSQKIRERYAEHQNLWFMLAIARQINWPDTLADLIKAGDGAWPLTRYKPEKLRSVMLRRKEAGKQVYTGAYILNAQKGPQYAGSPDDKAWFTAYLTLRSVWDARRQVEPALHGTLEEAHAAFLSYHGWGGFTAYEVVSDLRWTRYLEEAPDKKTWAYAGPGAKRGLNRVFGRETRAHIAPQKALAEMRSVYDYIAPRWPWRPPLEMREIEHSLCEFDKHQRATLGEGRPRARYTPK
jgi:hypothetical protein